MVLEQKKKKKLEFPGGLVVKDLVLSQVQITAVVQVQSWACPGYSQKKKKKKKNGAGHVLSVRYIIFYYLFLSSRDYCQIFSLLAIIS